MVTKKIKINWEKLKEAFDFHSAEMTYYLNIANGKVAFYSNLSGGFDEEGNEINEKDSFYKKHYIEIPATFSYEAYRDIEKFIDTVKDEQVKKKLRISVKDKLPIVSFKETISSFPKENDRWLSFKENQIRQRIVDWLKEHNLETED